MKLYKVKRWYYRCRKWIRRIAHLLFFFSVFCSLICFSSAAQLYNYESFYKLMGDVGYISCYARSAEGVDYWAASYKGTQVIDFDISAPAGIPEMCGLAFKCQNADNINQFFDSNYGLYISHTISICSKLNTLINCNTESFTFRVSYADSNGYTYYVSVSGDDMISSYKLERTTFDRLIFNIEAVVPLPDGSDFQITGIEYIFDDISTEEAVHFDIYPQYGDKVYYCVAPMDELPQYIAPDSSIHDDYAAAEEELLSQYDPNAGVNSIVSDANNALNDLSAPLTIAGAIVGRFLELEWISNVVTISLCCGVVLLLLGLVGRVITAARRE